MGQPPSQKFRRDSCGYGRTFLGRGFECTYTYISNYPKFALSAFLKR